jgi:hypothetical protein
MDDVRGLGVEDVSVGDKIIVVFGVVSVGIVVSKLIPKVCREGRWVEANSIVKEPGTSPWAPAAATTMTACATIGVVRCTRPTPLVCLVCLVIWSMVRSGAAKAAMMRTAMSEGSIPSSRSRRAAMARATAVAVLAVSTSSTSFVVRACVS